MNIEYAVSPRTNGANPFKIFEALPELDQDLLNMELRKMKYSVFMNTAYWFAVSSAAKSRAGMRCQVCNSQKQISTHHRTYDTHGKEHVNMHDLVVLCEMCHGLFHGHQSTVPVMQGERTVQHVEASEKHLRMKVQRPRKAIVYPHSDSDLVTPPEPVITLTLDLINACRANSAFTSATLRALGMTREKMQKGWVAKLVGIKILNSSYRDALKGRFIYKSGPIPMK